MSIRKTTKKASKKSSKAQAKTRMQTRPASNPLVIRPHRVDEVRIARHSDELRFARRDELIASRPSEVAVQWVA